MRLFKRKPKPSSEPVGQTPGPYAAYWWVPGCTCHWSAGVDTEYCDFCLSGDRARARQAGMFGTMNDPYGKNFGRDNTQAKPADDVVWCAVYMQPRDQSPCKRPCRDNTPGSDGAR